MKASEKRWENAGRNAKSAENQQLIFAGAQPPDRVHIDERRLLRLGDALGVGLGEDRLRGDAVDPDASWANLGGEVLRHDGYLTRGGRAADGERSEFFSSSDNWCRPTMLRTGPGGDLRDPF